MDAHYVDIYSMHDTLHLLRAPINEWMLKSFNNILFTWNIIQVEIFKMV